MGSRAVSKPRGGKYAPTHSVRVEPEIWDAAAARAAAEGYTMSNVMHMFIEGYASGRIAAPRVQVVYPKTGT